VVIEVQGELAVPLVFDAKLVQTLLEHLTDRPLTVTEVKKLEEEISGVALRRVKLVEGVS
jgi:hypothetical protein